jgi:site-specific DNA-methyltransferase (adenine-specific)
LWDRDHAGDCDYRQVVNGEDVGREHRDLRDGDGVLIRDSKALAIVKKIKGSKHFKGSLDSVVSTRDPFGASLTTNFGGSRSEPFSGSIPLVFQNKIGYVTKNQIQRNFDWISRHKVLLPKASDGRGATEGLSVLGEPIVLAPGSACTQSYLVAGVFDSRDEALRFGKYLTSKFVRVLVLQRKVSQDLTSERFKFVPALKMDRVWNDLELYELFGLNQEERDYIEKTVVPRTMIDSSKNPVPSTHLPGGVKFGKPSEEEVDDDE